MCIQNEQIIKKREHTLKKQISVLEGASFTLKLRSVNETSTIETKLTRTELIQPWNNCDGTKKTDHQIKSLGEGWSMNTWERYLDSSIGNLEDKKLSFFGYMDTKPMLDRANFLDLLQDKDIYPKVEKALKFSLKELTKREKIILVKYFWDGLTSEIIAKELKTTTTSIRTLKSRALKKLKNILPSEKFKRELKNANIL